jgi:prepilin-type processing-associated H-X9-DG protein
LDLVHGDQLKARFFMIVAAAAATGAERLFNMLFVDGAAAWLQRWLFGPAVPKSGWFAMLQRLAMKAS